MTGPPRGPAGQHLDLDALADVLAGERPDDPHLSACASCADRLTELQAAEVAVVASLAMLPDPALPEGLAERLAAALRAEPSAASSVVPLRRRRRVWLPQVAAAVVLVLAGGLGWSALQDAGTGEDDARTSAAGGAGEDSTSDTDTGGGAAAAARSTSGIDYADEALRDATLPRVLAGTASSALVGRPQSGAGSEAESEAESEAGPDAPAGPDPRSVPGADPLARLRDPAALESCLSALRPPQEPDQRPLALDYARFDGRPALAVVLPDPDPSKLSLFVVGPDCSAADDRTLLYARPDRP